MAFVTCEQFRKSQTEQDEKITEMTKCCESNNQKSEAQDKEIDNIKKRLDDLKSKNDSLKTENGKLSTELEACRSARKAEEDAKQAAENKAIGLQNDKAALEAKVKKLQDDLDKCKENSNSGNSTGGQDINSQTKPTPDQVPSGVTQPIQPLTCGGMYEYAGDNVRQSYYISVDKSQGFQWIDFTPYEIPDAIRIWKDKTLVFESYPTGIVYDPATEDTADGVVLANSAYINYEKNGQTIRADKLYDARGLVKVDNASVYQGIRLPQKGDRVTEDPALNFAVPVDKETKYIFIEVIPNKSDKTTWKLVTTCPAERVDD